VKKYRISNWGEIRDDFTDKLLLGNGASRAVWDGFKYPSLYEEAKKAGRIDLGLTQLLPWALMISNIFLDYYHKQDE